MNYITYDFITINVKEDNDPHEIYNGPYTTVAQFGSKRGEDITVNGMVVVECIKDSKGKSIYANTGNKIEFGSVVRDGS